MSDIDLVIRISEEDYKGLQEKDKFNDMYLNYYEKLIVHGKPLPKGHKRLIEDNFEVGPIFDKDGNRVGYKYLTQEALNKALTIIEADKEN